MASPNPYHYGTPVTGDQFAGREVELSALASRMRDGINVVVTAPRRYGKTSLLARASSGLVGEGAAVVSVNILACRDETSLASRLATAAYAARGGRWHRLRQATAEFAKRLRVSPTVTFDGDVPRFAFAPSLAVTDADMVIEDVYALLGELSARAPAVLVLDEFQAITDLGAPLYGLAERLALDVLPTQVMSDFLRRRASSAGKSMSAPVASRIIELAGPVPNDIQHLAYETWGAAGRSVTVDDVEAALARTVEHEASSYADRYGALASGQRRVLAALATAPSGEPYAASFVRGTGLASASSVGRALDALVAAELVVRRGGTYLVADPFLAAWLSRIV